MQTILDLGVRLVVALQGLGTWPTLPMQFFSFLGKEDFFMLALPSSTGAWTASWVSR